VAISNQIANHVSYEFLRITNQHEHPPIRPLNPMELHLIIKHGLNSNLNQWPSPKRLLHLWKWISHLFQLLRKTDSFIWQLWKEGILWLVDNEEAKRILSQRKDHEKTSLLQFIPPNLTPIDDDNYDGTDNQISYQWQVGLRHGSNYDQVKPYPIEAFTTNPAGLLNFSLDLLNTSNLLKYKYESVSYSGDGISPPAYLTLGQIPPELMKNEKERSEFKYSNLWAQDSNAHSPHLLMIQELSVNSNSDSGTTLWCFHQLPSKPIQVPIQLIGPQVEGQQQQ